MTIGEKIKMLRQKQGITQEKLADYLNISPEEIVEDVMMEDAPIGEAEEIILNEDDMNE